MNTTISLNGAAERLAAEREREAAEHVADENKYYAMLPSYAKHTQDQEQEFRAVRQRLGLSLDDLQNHLTIRASYASLMTAAAKIELQSAACQENDAATAAIDAAYVAATEKYHRERAALGQEQIVLRTRLDTSLRAKGEAEALIVEHHRILQVADPAEKQNYRNVILAYPTVAQCECQIAIQQIMHAPRSYGDPNKFTVTPTGEQAQDDADALHQYWRDLYSGKIKTAFFLAADDHGSAMSQVVTGGAIRTVMPISEIEPMLSCHPDTYSFEPAISLASTLMLNPPEQDREVFDKLRERLEKAERRERRKWEQDQPGYARRENVLVGE